MFKKDSPYLIAEIGGNHEGDFGYAKELTYLAVEAGVDSIKYQIYTGDTLVSPIQDQDRNNHFKKFELSINQYCELAKICKLHNIDFSASVWNAESVSEINEHMAFYKIGSGDLTNYPLIKMLCKLKKPIIISTGLSKLDEVQQTVEFISDQDSFYADSNNLAILQCTSMYPIPNEDANLEVINTFKKNFSYPIGYSDHTEGTAALITAVAMGAEILEFHFTNDKTGKTFRDHKVSLTVNDVKFLKSEISEIIKLKGTGKKKPLKIETDNGHHLSFRRSIYASNNLNAGDTLDEKNMLTLRPLHGIDARDFYKVIGKKLKTSKTKFESIAWEDLED
jgi:N-acetylneuraminate synthase/N,N'-diacetyllegionaminate synthase